MNERQLSEPCSICKHWVGAEEACPDLQNYISNLCGQMCAQGIQRFYRQFCATSVNTRFERRDGITEEIMKKYLSDDARNAIYMKLPERCNSSETLSVRFEHFEH